MSFSLEEYNKYQIAKRGIQLFKDPDDKYFLQLKTFDSWTGIEIPPEYIEIDLTLLQKQIDSLMESLKALSLLQENLLAL